MNRTRTTRALVLGIVLLFLGTACSIRPQPDEISLHYKGGVFDGNKFEKVVEPGTRVSNITIADNVYTLPTSLRTWNIATDDMADQNEPIVVPTSDGVLVNVWSQTNLVLNSNTDDIPDFPGGTLRKFWESLGRYDPHTPEGWRDTMLVTVAPALEKATTDTIREYEADPLVYNQEGIHAEVQRKIGQRFLENLKRLTGGDYFCGPTFVRGEGTCPSPELILRGIDYHNPAIQEARDQRRREQELAAARLVEAEGHLAAQAALEDALENPAYLNYLIAQMELEAAKACASSSNCTYIAGSGGVTPTITVR